LAGAAARVERACRCASMIPAQALNPKPQAYASICLSISISSSAVQATGQAARRPPTVLRMLVPYEMHACAGGGVLACMCGTAGRWAGCSGSLVCCDLQGLWHERRP
jgi:hypothetical protein